MTLLRRIIEWLFGDGGYGSGEGRSLALEWSEPWAAWGTLLVAIFAVVFVIVVYAKEQTAGRRRVKVLLAILRLGLIALVLLMLYEHTLREYRTDLPDVVIVLDDSASMLVVDQYEDEEFQARLARRVEAAGFQEATRLNLAKTLLLEKDAALLRNLAKKYRLKFYRIANTARAQPTGERELIESIRNLEIDEQAREHNSSRLGQCVREILTAQRGRPTAAIIVLTDGVATDGKTIGGVARLAQRKTVALFTVGLGNDRPLRDVRLSDLLADKVVFFGDAVNFQLKVTANGYEGRDVQAELRRKGEARVLAATTIKLGEDGQSAAVRLSHRPTETGQFQYVVEIVPLDGEVKTDNNTSGPQEVTVRDDAIRVLLVQAYPNYEFRFLKQLLSRQLKPPRAGAAAGREKAFELTTVLQEADPEYAGTDETAQRVFPVRRDELFEYDVIVFGDVNPSFLSRTQIQNIADFVTERGGGIIVMAGPRYTPLAYRDSPLADLLPVDLSTARLPDPGRVLTRSFVVQPTSLGLASSQMQLGDSPEETIERWQKLPGLYWLLETPETKAGARVLAEHPTLTGSDGRNLPVISMQFVGAGKVVFHATDETWRWRYQIGDALFGRYWVQTIRYLSRSKLLGKARSAEMTADQKQYTAGEPVRLRVRFFDDRLAPAQDDGVLVVVQHEGAKHRRIQLQRNRMRGNFETTLSNLPPGGYHAWVARPTFPSGAPSCDFTVIAPPGEQARLEMDSKDLKSAAEKSDGQYYTMKDAHRLLKRLPAGRQVRVEQLDPINIWNSGILAAFFVAMIVAEWLIRKRAGLL